MLETLKLNDQHVVVQSKALGHSNLRLVEIEMKSYMRSYSDGNQNSKGQQKDLYSSFEQLLDLVALSLFMRFQHHFDLGFFLVNVVTFLLLHLKTVYQLQWNQLESLN